jgi:hypothetical protein
MRVLGQQPGQGECGHSGISAGQRSSDVRPRPARTWRAVSPICAARLRCGLYPAIIWDMAGFQITSIAEPIASDAEASWAVVRLVTRVDFLGMLDDLEGAHVVDRQLLALIFSRLSDVGVGKKGGLLFSAAHQVEDYRRLVEDALEETEHSPMPENEWHRLQATLGDEMLAELLGISPASERRYSRGERVTPDEIADRLHFLALLVADLSGSYNDYGVRRWFDRPRQALAGRAPCSFLGAGFEPRSDDSSALRRLAAALVGAGAS